jgi:hypothetical protein
MKRTIKMRMERDALYDQGTEELAETVALWVNKAFFEVDPEFKTPAFAELRKDERGRTDIVVTVASGRQFVLQMLELV